MSTTPKAFATTASPVLALVVLLAVGAVPLAAGIVPSTATMRVHDLAVLTQEHPHVCAGPGGTWVAVWQLGQSGHPDSEGVRARRFSPAGQPITGEVVVDVAGNRGFAQDVACFPSGGFVVVWVTGLDDLDARARLFDAAGSPLGEVIHVSSDPEAEESSLAVGAAADGRFAVVFHHKDTQIPFEDRVLLKRFDTTGAPLGPAEPVHVTPVRFEPQPRIAMAPTGEAVVTWLGATAGELFGRRFASDGQALGPELLLHRDEQNAEISSPRAALGTGTRFLVAWSQSSSFGLFDFRAWARMFDEDGNALGAPIPLDPADYQQVATAVVRIPQGFVIGWIDLTDDGLVARVLDGAGGYLTPAVRLDTTYAGTRSFGSIVELAALSTTGVVAVWNPFVADAEGAVSPDVVARQFVISSASPDPPPPAGAWASEPTLPGFRFKARFQGAIAGKQVTPCIAETVCMSGALAGRAELLARVIGPRPNGFLWPTLVRFTTAQVEVWIEQSSSGIVRYYSLPAIPRDSDELTGLVDRTGFVP